jgi:hypothetical protein
MRYSPFRAREITAAGSPTASNERFFADVAREIGASALHGSILLTGGRDPRSLALRRAQGVLRFDRHASRWSHASLIVRWQSEPANTVGLEVTLDPVDSRRQVPERNGVTAFQLSRYFDPERYPNVALLTFGFHAPSPTGGSGAGTLPTSVERRALVIETALTPVRERERYPLWDTLGVWARHAYLPYSTPNPLLEGVPLPCASLCEYAYEAAGVDLTPGATGNHNCPEVLYATAKHWADGVAQTQDVSVRIFALVRDEHDQPQKDLPVRFDELTPPSRAELGERPSSTPPSSG